MVAVRVAADKVRQSTRQGQSLLLAVFGQTILAVGQEFPRLLSAVFRLAAFLDAARLEPLRGGFAIEVARLRIGSRATLAARGEELLDARGTLDVASASGNALLLDLGGGVAATLGAGRGLRRLVAITTLLQAAFEELVDCATALAGSLSLALLGVVAGLDAGLDLLLEAIQAAREPFTSRMNTTLLARLGPRWTILEALLQDLDGLVTALPRSAACLGAFGKDAVSDSHATNRARRTAVVTTVGALVVKDTGLVGTLLWIVASLEALLAEGAGLHGADDHARVGRWGRLGAALGAGLQGLLTLRGAFPFRPASLATLGNDLAGEVSAALLAIRRIGNLTVLTAVAQEVAGALVAGSRIRVRMILEALLEQLLGSPLAALRAVRRGRAVATIEAFLQDFLGFRTTPHGITAVRHALLGKSPGVLLAALFTARRGRRRVVALVQTLFQESLRLRGAFRVGSASGAALRMELTRRALAALGAGGLFGGLIAAVEAFLGKRIGLALTLGRIAVIGEALLEQIHGGVLATIRTARRGRRLAAGQAALEELSRPGFAVLAACGRTLIEETPCSLTTGHLAAGGRRSRLAPGQAFPERRLKDGLAALGAASTCRALVARFFGDPETQRLAVARRRRFAAPEAGHQRFLGLDFTPSGVSTLCKATALELLCLAGAGLFAAHWRRRRGLTAGQTDLKGLPGDERAALRGTTFSGASSRDLQRLGLAPLLAGRLRRWGGRALLLAGHDSNLEGVLALLGAPMSLCTGVQSLFGLAEASIQARKRRGHGINLQASLEKRLAHRCAISVTPTEQLALVKNLLGNLPASIGIEADLVGLELDTQAHRKEEKQTQ